MILIKVSQRRPYGQQHDEEDVLGLPVAVTDARRDGGGTQPLPDTGGRRHPPTRVRGPARAADMIDLHFADIRARIERPHVP